MESYKIESNGKQFIFNVLKNTTSPCPQCGVPACGKEDILWYEDNGKRIALVFDGGYFDLAGEEFLKNHVGTTDYERLPTFMKEWNESRGWTECWDYNGYVLQIDDFLESMELLKRCELGRWITMEDINDMKGIANNAQKIGAELKIVRG